MKWLLIEERLTSRKEVDDELIDKPDEPIDLDSLVLNIVDDDLVEEGAGKAIAFSVLAFLLTSMGMVEGAEFRKGALKFMQDKQVENGRVTITKGELRGLVEQAKVPTKMAGRWTEVQAKNILMRTLYAEARGDKKPGMDMVMTVIWNRGAQDLRHLADECLRTEQFSCWNSVTNSLKTPSTYKVEFPEGAKAKSGEDRQMWLVASNIVESVFSGNFQPVNSQWNAYYNPDKAHPSWAKKLRNTKMVGHHLVGTLQDQIQHAKNLKKKDQMMAGVKPTQVAQVKTKNYTVKDDDTLWSIAGKKMSVVNQIKALNGLKSDTIHPGQTLKIPA